MTSPSGDAAAVAAAEAYVAQQTAAVATLAERTLTALAALWVGIDDHRDSAAIGRFVERAATVIRAAESATARVTEAYMRRVLRSMGESVPARALATRPESLRFGIPLEEVVARPSATVRYLRSVDTPADAAVAAGAARLASTAETHVALAARQAANDVVVRLDSVRAYRRVIRPELSAGGSCGLCIAASDRVYRKGDLLPIHDKCKCIVMPIVRGADPGLRINDDDLAELYRSAGGTAAARLKRVRYRLESHGELGPVLVPEGRGFRSAADAGEAALGAPRASRRPDTAASYRAQLTSMEASIAALEDRERAGEDVSAPLTWQRARAAELRRHLRGRTAA